MYIIPYHLFQQHIICHFRGNFYESNNIIMPISQKCHEEYQAFVVKIKKSCCFDYWHNNIYDNKYDYIILINNNLLNHEINKDLLKSIYIKERDYDYLMYPHFCHCSAIKRRLRIIPFVSKFKHDKTSAEVLSETCCTNISDSNCKWIIPFKKIHKKNIYDIQYNTLNFFSKKNYSKHSKHSKYRQYHK